MAPLHLCGNGHWMGSLDSEYVSLQKNFGLQEENINISKQQGKNTNYENGMGYHKKVKERKREKEEGRMQCFMKKKDKSLLDVENVETTGVRCCHLSCRTQLNCSLCMFIGMKHISPTFRFIIPMYLRLTTFTKTLPQMSFHLICCYFSALGLLS